VELFCRDTLLVDWCKVIVRGDHIVSCCKSKVGPSMSHVHRKGSVDRKHVFKLLQEFFVILLSKLFFPLTTSPGSKPPRIDLTSEQKMIRSCECIKVVLIVQVLVHGQNSVIPKNCVIFVAIQNVVKVKRTADVNFVPEPFQLINVKFLFSNPTWFVLDLDH